MFRISGVRLDVVRWVILLIIEGFFIVDVVMGMG